MEIQVLASYEAPEFSNSLFLKKSPEFNFITENKEGALLMLHFEDGIHKTLKDSTCTSWL